MLDRGASFARRSAPALFSIALMWWGCSDETAPDTTGGGTSGSAASSSSDASSSSASSSSSSGGGSDFAERVGLSCEDDVDCGPDLFCLRAVDDDPVWGGGIAGGYCTKHCF